VILAIVVLFLVSLGQGVTLPLLPAMAQSGSGEASVLGVVYASHGAARIVIQPFGGVWVDRAGGQRVLTVAACLYAAALAGFFFTSSAEEMLVLRIATGMATGLAYPAVFALSIETVPPERQGRRMSLVLAMGTSGMVVGPVLAALLSPRGLRLPLSLALTPAVVVAVGLVFAQVFAKKPPETRAVRNLGDELRAMRGLFLDVALLAAVIPVAFNKLTFSAFQALLPIHGKEVLGLGHRGVSLLFLATGVTFAAVQPLGGWLADRFHPRTVSLALTPVLLFILVSMSLVPSTPFAPFVVAYVSYVAVSSLIYIATLKLVTRTHGSPGRYGGLYGSAATLTDPWTVVGPIVFMNAYAGARNRTFAIMAGVGLLSGAVFALATRRAEPARKIDA
jgi:DHA1 family chloramphenicol resistance protein-like MFS transporter